MKSMYCPRCGHVGRPRRVARGTMGVEVALWLPAVALLLFAPAAGLFLIAAALAYSLWRLLAGRRRCCTSCGADGLIPADSPLAQPPVEPAAPTPLPPTTPADEYVHELNAASGGTYRVLAAHQLDTGATKALIARAIQSGRVQPPHAGQVVTLRVP